MIDLVQLIHFQVQYYAFHLYFVVFKSKKDNDYKLFTNEIFDSEKKANEFGKKSMKRGFEHKVLEYTKDNVDRYWYDEKR